VRRRAENLLASPTGTVPIVTPHVSVKVPATPMPIVGWTAEQRIGVAT
jgi:hypothetical protein